MSPLFKVGDLVVRNPQEQGVAGWPYGDEVCRVVEYYPNLNEIAVVPADSPPNTRHHGISWLADRFTPAPRSAPLALRLSEGLGPNAQDVARERVDDVLMIVASYGPWGADLNDSHRRQIVLADEVHRLRRLYEMAVHGRAEMRAALRQERADLAGSDHRDRAGRHAGRAGVLCGEGDGMSSLRDAAQQALEALEPYADIKPRDWKTDREKLWRSYDALRAALAEQAEQEHQPWCASLTQLLMSNPPKPAPCNCKPEPERGPVEATPYSLKRIAWELERTAMGDGFYGNALRVAKDIPGITPEDRSVLDRYATGTQTCTDHVHLQWLAQRLLAHEGTSAGAPGVLIGAKS